MLAAITKTLVQAFINSLPGYCSQLFPGINGRLLDKPQSLQKATALYLVTGARKFDRIMLCLRCESTIGLQFGTEVRVQSNNNNGV